MVGMTGDDGTAEAFERFRARTREIGLTLQDEDMRELFHGWTTLQPLLRSLRDEASQAPVGPASGQSHER